MRMFGNGWLSRNRGVDVSPGESDEAGTLWPPRSRSASSSSRLSPPKARTARRAGSRGTARAAWWSRGSRAASACVGLAVVVVVALTHRLAVFTFTTSFPPLPLARGAIGDDGDARSVRNLQFVATGRQALGGAAAVVPAEPGAGRGVGALLEAFRLDFAKQLQQLLRERALEKHEGACGEAPEVDIIRAGEDGVFAVACTLRLAESAQSVYDKITDPDENLRIFKRTAVALNYRKLLNEDKGAGTRLFETSKSGRWRLLGIPFAFESTVYALEDQKSLEIQYRLKTKGAMKHLSGFWRVVPVGPRESLVLYYNEATPNLPIPSLFRHFASRFMQEMASSLLLDLQDASRTWSASSAASG